MVSPKRNYNGDYRYKFKHTDSETDADADICVGRRPRRPDQSPTKKRLRL